MQRIKKVLQSFIYKSNGVLLNTHQIQAYRIYSARSFCPSRLNPVDSLPLTASQLIVSIGSVQIPDPNNVLDEVYWIDTPGRSSIPVQQQDLRTGA